MTPDERKRQRELFEAWKRENEVEYGYARAAWDAWQAACDANGVGEPSDVEGLRQACKKARDLLVMGRLRFNSRNVDPVIEELNAVLGEERG